MCILSIHEDEHSWCICKNSQNPAALPDGEHLLSTYKAARFSSQMLSGRSVADVGCEPVLHMRHFQDSRRDMEALQRACTLEAELALVLIKDRHEYARARAQVLSSKGAYQEKEAEAEWEINEGNNMNKKGNQKAGHIKVGNTTTTNGAAMNLPRNGRFVFNAGNEGDSQECGDIEFWNTRAS